MSLATAADHREVERQVAKATPAGLASYASGGRWKAAPHHLELDRYLWRLAFGLILRLITAMPPRHGKSELSSHYFPVWYLGNWPDRWVGLAAYGDQYAATWGQKVRDTLNRVGPELFGVRVSANTSARDYWTLERWTGTRWVPAEGGMFTAGVGGSMTGKGAHLLLVDDPIKNDQEANSETYRDRHWEWWLATASTRLMAPDGFEDGSAAVTATRWHEDDLTGRLKVGQDEEELGDEAEPWTELSLAALYEEGMDEDPLGRQPGDALWPEKFPERRLRRIRRRLGSYWWNSLYQQRPQPASGGVFSRLTFRYCRLTQGVLELDQGVTVKRWRMADCLVFGTMDLAASTKTSADYTVLSTWALTPHRELALVDVVRDRFEGPDQLPLITRAHQRWHHAYIAVEAVAYQLTMVQNALRAGLPVKRLEVDKDKLSRALGAQPFLEGGQVYWLHGAPWLQEWEDELTAFPKTKHDDQVDTFSAAAAELSLGLGEVGYAPSLYD